MKNLIILKKIHIRISTKIIILCSLSLTFSTADKNIAAKRRKFKNDHLNPLINPLIEHRENMIFDIIDFQINTAENNTKYVV